MDRIWSTVQGEPALILPPLQLRSLQVRRFAPAAPLRPWVECYWLLQGGATDVPATEEKLYPDGGASLLIDLDGQSDATLHASTRLLRACLAAPVDRLGIRFQPGGAAGLFGLVMAPLLDIPLAVDRLGLAAVEPLIPALRAATELRRVALLDDWLLGLAARRSLAKGPLQRVLPALVAGRLDIEAVVRTHGLSRRTLERHVRRDVGLSPAQLSRLNQVKRARRLLAETDEPISTVALACGFHDQAHLTHHFRQISDETPAAYRRRKLAQIYNP